MMRLLDTLLYTGVAIFAYAAYKIILAVSLSRRNAQKAKDLNCMPVTVWGNAWPLGIDHIYRFWRASEANKFPQELIKCTEDAGSITYAENVLGEYEIFTNEPENLKALLYAQFDDFEIPHMRAGAFMPLFGKGIFGQNGKEWEHSRAMLRPQFARSQISDLDLEERHVRNLMKCLPTESDGWTKPVDLKVLLLRLTMDTATEFLFGSSANSQSEEVNSKGFGKATSTNAGPSCLEFSKAFHAGQEMISYRIQLGNLYWLMNPKSFQKNCKTVHEFMDRIVAEGLRRNPKGKPVGTERFVFLDYLTTQTRDPIEIRSQLLHILLAGRDTTAALLSWTLFILAREPKQFTKLRNCILQEFGPYSNNTERITFTSLRDCTLLQYFLKETQRLYPTITWNARIAVKDTTLPRGGGPDGKGKVFVPNGTFVSWSTHVMHHLKESWGEDAEEFIPERWDGRKPGFDYLPFNAGPRVCLGQQFALTEAAFVIVRLMQRFDKIDNLGSIGEVEHIMTLGTSPADGVRVRLHEAADAKR